VIAIGERNGWQAVTLEHDGLRVTVLPERGAEIASLVDLESGIELLFQAPWGLHPPGAPAREGADGHVFLERYAGGWQELFPGGNGPCRVAGETIPFHGEAAIVPWEVEEADEALRLSVTCATVPFRLERRMSIAGRTLAVDGSVTNLSADAAHFAWGHHCVLGPPLVAAGCRFDCAAGTIVTIPEMWEETARLAPGQRSAWPTARLRAGGTVDLREIPGRQAGSHDDVYLTDLTDGWATVTNDALALRFRLEWEADLFGWIISWQPYGGARAMPLAGAYGLGVEPWVTMLDLERAIAAGEAIELGAGETRTTPLRASVETLP
jgi:galactose mutarotase-like enzyme